MKFRLLPDYTRQQLAVGWLLSEVLERPMEDSTLGRLHSRYHDWQRLLPSDSARDRRCAVHTEVFAHSIISLALDTLKPAGQGSTELTKQRIEFIQRGFPEMIDDVVTGRMLDDGFILKQRKTQEVVNNASLRTDHFTSGYRTSFFRYYVVRMANLGLSDYEPPATTLPDHKLAREFLRLLGQRRKDGGFDKVAEVWLLLGRELKLDKYLKRTVHNLTKQWGTSDQETTALILRKLIPAVCDRLGLEV